MTGDMSNFVQMSTFLGLFTKRKYKFQIININSTENADPILEMQRLGKFYDDKNLQLAKVS